MGYNDRLDLTVLRFVEYWGERKTYMRHGASLLASLEGMSRPAYLIARELCNNSRSGLTVRFLSKKLEMPEEEVEYLIDVNHRLVFTDLTKIKVVPEGHGAVKRITDGLENHGDVPSLFRRTKVLTPHEFRRLEEYIGATEPLTKKGAAEDLLNRYYTHPDSLVSYVAHRGFSETAREVFDILWQSKNGVMPVSQIRVAHGGAEFDVEQALWELFRGFALFEMFRFDAEDRLIRMAGLLSELRQWQESAAKHAKKKAKLKVLRGKPDAATPRGLDFSDTICKLVAAIAARPARLRGDGDLFREDRRRLNEICPEEADPSMSTCLWVAEGVGWLARVDNTLRAGALDQLVMMDRVGRHRILYDWLVSQGDDSVSRNLFAALLEEIRSGAWYSVIDFIRYAMHVSAAHEQPVLKPVGAHWEYVSPSTSGHMESRLARSLEETFFWLGIVDRGELNGESVFRVSELGEAFLRNTGASKLQKAFPPRKGEIVVQPNFDIVVPTQDMDPLLTVPLDQFALRASTGQATVYNVTKDSFTQAVQEGHDASAFVEFLIAHNRSGGLPANVMMTLEDWRGTMKRVRLRTIAVLETDDPILMADIRHRRRVGKHLKEIDPKTVAAYKGISKAELTKFLEKDGFIVE